MFYSVYGTADVSSIHKTFAVVGNAPIIILPCGMGQCSVNFEIMSFHPETNLFQYKHPHTFSFLDFSTLKLQLFGRKNLSDPMGAEK